jgi:cell wall-associated NlpC family hydrolase
VQPAVQPAVHLDLTARRPGAATMHHQPAAPAGPAPASSRQTPTTCSGLVWLAWQHAGLTWTRMSAAAQWRWLHQRGSDVPASQVRAGDLLFYANDPSDPASIHHVSMAIGDGRMVEAPAPGIPVRIVGLRWPELFAVARPIP